MHQPKINWRMLARKRCNPDFRLRKMMRSALLFMILKPPWEC
ncbi:hypothetical protein SynA15127_01150 [Synechococcus sp. A15-127]|nr:hypothetical protein SynA15127_01150 [Synechococcus sp. A15-127]